MPRQIALLRGVNVGGNRKLPMAELRATLATAGYGEVRTHLQSGNVILDSANRIACIAHATEQFLERRIVCAHFCAGQSLYERLRFRAFEIGVANTRGIRRHEGRIFPRSGVAEIAEHAAQHGLRVDENDKAVLGIAGSKWGLWKF